MDNENVAGPSGKGTNAGPPQNENGETTPQTECQVDIYIFIYFQLPVGFQ